MHSSGIPVSSELEKLFAESVSKGSKGPRFIIVKIENECLVHKRVIEAQGSDWMQEWDNVTPYLKGESSEAKDPAYILFRTENSNASGMGWIFVTFVPEKASVRDKMLYASTRNAFLRTLGEPRFTDSMYATSLAEVSLEGYRKHLLAQESEAPLTEREKEMARIRKEESLGSGSALNSGNLISLAALSSTAPNVKNDNNPAGLFPLSEDAKKAISDFSSNALGMVCVRIDANSQDSPTTQHTIQLVHAAASLDIKKIPHETPSYVIFRYKTSHIFFLYLCPVGCKVSLRMIHSSCKAPMLKFLTSSNIKIGKKLEMDDIKELTDEFLAESLLGSTDSLNATDSKTGSNSNLSFKKPARPGRK